MPIFNFYYLGLLLEESTNKLQSDQISYFRKSVKVNFSLKNCKDRMYMTMCLTRDTGFVSSYLGLDVFPISLSLNHLTQRKLFPLNEFDLLK